ncbi:hypothetical protein Hanom_Chr15g01364791 [Helianthus anomalus]
MAYFRGSGSELKKTGLAFGVFTFELLDLLPFCFSLFLEPSDPDGVLGGADVPVPHARHICF